MNKSMFIAAILIVISMFNIAMLLAAIIYSDSVMIFSLLCALIANICALFCFGFFISYNAKTNLAHYYSKIMTTFYTRIFTQSLENFLALSFECMLDYKYDLEQKIKNHVNQLNYILIIIVFMVINIAVFMFIFWPMAVLICLIGFAVMFLRVYIENICVSFEHQLKKYNSQRWQMLNAVQASFNMWANLGEQKALLAKLLDNNNDIAKYKTKKIRFLAFLSALKIIIPLLSVIVLSVILYKTQIDIAKFWLVILSFDVLGLALAWSYLLNFYDFSFSKPSLKNLPPKKHSGHLIPVNIAGRIEVVDLSFSYYNNSVLVINNMNLLIDIGGFYSVIGASGSGKSTLLKILMAQLTPSRGQLIFDGQDMRSLDLDSLRSHFGIVAQDSRLFPGSIYDNILCGRKLGSRAIENLLYSHEIFDAILDLPMGLQTQIFLASPNLSRAQILVILLARSLVHQPKILFLDEIFTGISNSEQILISAYLSSLSISRIISLHHERAHLSSQAIYL